MAGKAVAAGLSLLLEELVQGAATGGCWVRWQVEGRGSRHAIVDSEGCRSISAEKSIEKQYEQEARKHVGSSKVGGQR